MFLCKNYPKKVYLRVPKLCQEKVSFLHSKRDLEFSRINLRAAYRKTRVNLLNIWQWYSLPNTFLIIFKNIYHILIPYIFIYIRCKCSNLHEACLSSSNIWHAFVSKYQHVSCLTMMHDLLCNFLNFKYVNTCARPKRKNTYYKK